MHRVTDGGVEGGEDREIPRSPRFQKGKQVSRYLWVAHSLEKLASERHKCAGCLFASKQHLEWNHSIKDAQIITFLQDLIR